MRGRGEPTVARSDIDDGRVGGDPHWRDGVAIQLDELTRRNPSALGMDALYLITTSFFTVLLTKAWEPIAIGIPFTSVTLGSLPFSWPLLIAAIPLGGLLYFGYRSSKAFFASQLVIIVITLLAARADLLPL